MGRCVCGGGMGVGVGCVVSCVLVRSRWSGGVMGVGGYVGWVVWWGGGEMGKGGWVGDVVGVGGVVVCWGWVGVGWEVVG